MFVALIKMNKLSFFCWEFESLCFFRSTFALNTLQVDEFVVKMVWIKQAHTIILPLLCFPALRCLSSPKTYVETNLSVSHFIILNPRACLRSWHSFRMYLSDIFLLYCSKKILYLYCCNCCKCGLNIDISVPCCIFSVSVISLHVVKSVSDFHRSCDMNKKEKCEF